MGIPEASGEDPEPPSFRALRPASGAPAVQKYEFGVRTFLEGYGHLVRFVPAAISR